MLNNKVDARNVAIEYAYATMDDYGWSGHLAKTNAEEVLKRGGDVELHRCQKCGRLYDPCDWEVGFCPTCAKESLGDSHDWTTAQWSLWNGDSRLYLKNFSDEEVAEKLNEEFAGEDEEPITPDYIAKVRELERFAKFEEPVCTLKEYAQSEIDRYEK